MPKLKFQGGYVPTCSIDITEDEERLLKSPPSEEREALRVALTEQMYEEIDNSVSCGQGGVYITGCEYSDFVDGMPFFDSGSEVSEGYDE
jgi:hypothetical protein